MDDGERFPPPTRERRPAPPEQRPAPPPVILDRFRAMVRMREEELRVEGEDGDDETTPPLSTDEFVQLYEEILSELTFNSKPIITELTMIAGEHREHARGIANAICNRILTVPVNQKLPSLYLLDSIVKNIGREYARHFATCLPKVFCEAYNEVDSNLHPAMRHLFETWSQVFHPSVLRKIEDELQFSTPSNQRSTGLADTRHSESPSPRPSHGIHVNPKYLETRRQLEQLDYSASDVQQSRGDSSSLQVYGQKSSIPYDFDHTEVLPSRLGMSRAVSPRPAVVHASSMGGVDETLPRLRSRGSRPSSPRFGVRRSVSPVDDRFHRDISPGRVERASPSHSGFGHGRVSDQNGLLEKKWLSDAAAQQRRSSSGYSLNNGHSKQRSRELVGTYGNYRGTDNFLGKHPKVQRLDVSGINNEATTRNWQASEEEEYIWEDMSPTLADRGNRNRLQPFGPFNSRPGLNRSDDRVREPDFRRRSWGDQPSLPPVDDEDRIPAPCSDYGSMNKYLDGAGSQNESLLRYQSSRPLLEPGKFSHSLPHYSLPTLSPKRLGRPLHVPYPPANVMIPSIGQKLPGSYDNFPGAEVSIRRFPNIHSGNMNVETTAIEKHLAQRQYSPPRPPPVVYPPIPKSHLQPLPPIPSGQKQFNSQCDFIEGNKPVLNQGPNSSLFLPWQQYDAADRKPTTWNKPLQLPYQLPGSMHVNQQSQELSSTIVQTREAQGSFIPSAHSQHSSHLPQPLNHRQTQRQGIVMGSDFSNPLSGVPSSVGMQSMPDTALHVHGGGLPPLPLGPPPALSQAGPASQNIASTISISPANAFPGLIGTLVAQGLISLTPSGQSQDSVGVEFNTELLKVRHESIINALYSDLPRQCTTCGLRFKCQEEHSSHMDWHVTKNRISKNRKQKPSRKWFVNAKEWLSGAEILGTDVVPGFLPTETVTEKNEDRELAVPADENQNVCALCGELFEDFYSDETEEWMYKGAVYLNAPNGNIEGLERFQLGPIVHAKCRPESAEDTGQS